MTTIAAVTTSQAEQSQKPLDPRQERIVRPVLTAMTQAGITWTIGNDPTGETVEVVVNTTPWNAITSVANKLGTIDIVQYVSCGTTAAQIDLMETDRETAAAPVRLRLRREGKSAGAMSWLINTRFGLRRWMKPDGLMIVFLGPDGVGKSTAIKNLQEGVLAKVFRSRKSFHFRTDTVKPAPHGNGMVRDPHGKEPRGLIMSLAKIALWWTDYTLGYFKEVLPRLSQGSLVIFDRYVYDLLIDQRRYRYGGPMALLNWMARSVPKPDLLVVLHAPAEVVHQRKQDLTLEETARQLEAFSKMAKRNPNGHIVNANRPAAEVVSECEQIVLQHLSRRARQRLGISERR